MLSRIAIAAVATGLASQAVAAALPAAQTADPYFQSGRAALARELAVKPNTGRAKNVILFLGDGMGDSTVTAARIFEGQQAGRDGASNSLAFEMLPYAALSKTYSNDGLVTDSAAGIHAILTGTKTNNGLLGLTGAVKYGDCAGSAGHEVASLMELAKQRALSTGAITTTRLTHATPAGTYAHTASRDWEADSDMEPADRAAGCIDIARQLVEAPAALRLDVAMGGGRDRFRPVSAGGKRADGKDLTAEWVSGLPGSIYVETADQLRNAATNGGPLLGLFAVDHLPFEADRATKGQGVPTLSEMTAAAIDRLSRNKNGFVLLVEGGRIDHANHSNNAYRALSEARELSNAVRTALSKVDLKDTLIVVTADHSHGLVFSGYAPRDTSILGLAHATEAESTAKDGKAYTLLGYMTGPGAAVNMPRIDPKTVDTTAPDYRQESLIPMPSDAHSGEDVPVFAGGPQAYLLRGVVEESYIFQVMAHALGLDKHIR